QRLRALITADGQKRSLTLLALGPKDSKSILDAYFAGPYTEADVADIEALSKTLSQSAFDKIDEDAAKALLASRNPWEAYLGLVRLESLGILSAAHFTKVATILPVPNAETCAIEMFETAIGNQAVGRDTSKELCRFFRDAQPERQARLLAKVVEYLGRNWSRISKLVDVMQLREAARDYRTMILDDKTRAPVITEV